MSTRAFFLLFLAALALNLGLRFGVAALLQQAAVAAVPEKSAEPMMALPPKPEGLEHAAPAGEGDGTGGQTVVTPDACIQRFQGTGRDICLQSASRQLAPRDPKGALQICDQIADEQLRWECHADTAEAISLLDRVAADAICTDIPVVKWRGQCFFGMGLALAEVDPTYAFGRCEKAEIFRDFCRHDVVGEVSLVSLEPAVAFCAQEQGDVLTRKTCWHGIGKYIARRDLQEAAAACERATESWRGNCFHGVGWGAAERDVDAAVAGCDTLGPFRDNCRQGVAHEQKRADPNRAVALCESIQSTEIKARCLKFVRG